MAANPSRTVHRFIAPQTSHARGRLHTRGGETPFSAATRCRSPCPRRLIGCALVARRTHALIVIAGLSGCLSAMAPAMRGEPHRDLDRTSSRSSCMTCHVAEVEALVSDAPPSASLVAQWMLDDPRECTACHKPARRR